MKDTLLKLFKMFFWFSGRINRLRYFLYSLVPSLIMIAITSSFESTYHSFIPTVIIKIILALKILLFLLCFISQISLYVRRLHDLDQTGFLVIASFTYIFPIMILEILPIIFYIYILFVKGTHGKNRYGPDPLYIDDLYAPSM